MTDKIKSRLEEIKALAERATPGPWEFDHGVNTQTGTFTRAIYSKPSEFHTLEIIETPDEEGGECIHQSDDDGRLMAAARTDIPALVSALEIAVGALKAIRDRVEMYGAGVYRDAGLQPVHNREAAEALAQIEEALK